MLVTDVPHCKPPLDNTGLVCVWVYVDLRSQVASCQTLNLIVRKGITTRFRLGDKLYFSDLGSATTRLLLLLRPAAQS